MHAPIDINQPLALLGGLTPKTFMREYWQRKPLLIRQAIPGFKPPVSVADLKRMSKQDEVESRLVWKENARWQLEKGPFSRLPKASEPDWTLLVQSVDQHVDAAAALTHQFRFVPDARMDDLMISIATDGGGVGPHYDSYDVFLLQGVGQRRWRIGAQQDQTLIPGLPVRILQNFQPEAEYVLEPGDMLYLPPQYAHDGIAVGDCMTLSIGFRTLTQQALAQGMLEAALDRMAASAGMQGGLYADPPLPMPRLDNVYYRDPGQPAVTTPAALPDGMIKAALQAVGKIRFDEKLAIRFLGCWLTEPNALAEFDSPEDAPDFTEAWPTSGSLRLDRRSRLLYRDKSFFINGETLQHAAHPLLYALADQRTIACADYRRLPASLRDLLTAWVEDGWLHYAAAQ
ncbi:cupin domain-containing protein [Alcaligenaceae bacterium SJ-26]|nr:cupin domain-containing protein [Alcaligenaceae bacterium SJ-26]